MTTRKPSDEKQGHRKDWTQDRQITHMQQNFRVARVPPWRNRACGMSNTRLLGHCNGCSPSGGGGGAAAGDDDDPESQTRIARRLDTGCRHTKLCGSALWRRQEPCSRTGSRTPSWVGSATSTTTSLGQIASRSRCPCRKSTGVDAVQA
jgi:hypothetical protein